MFSRELDCNVVLSGLELNIPIEMGGLPISMGMAPALGLFSLRIHFVLLSLGAAFVNSWCILVVK